MPHSFTDLLTHAIFSTKNREPFIEESVSRELFPYLGGVVKHIGGKALLVNGMADHVHILLRLPANVAVAECMRLAKANSSKWVHEHWPERARFEWQIGYAAFSVSLSQRDAVYRYIRDQQMHHRTKTFVEEIESFARKYGGDTTSILE